MKSKVKHKVYHYSINILTFHDNGISKIYEIKEGVNPVLPGLKYSLITILLGWWSIEIFNIFRFKFVNPFQAWINSANALEINFSGGDDLTKLLNSEKYDSKTNITLSFLDRDIHSKIELEDLEIIIGLIEEYHHQQIESDVNNTIDFVLEKLERINITYLNREDILKIIDALRNTTSF
jgi:hypothetical protein